MARRSAIASCVCLRSSTGGISLAAPVTNSFGSQIRCEELLFEMGSKGRILYFGRRVPEKGLGCITPAAVRTPMAFLARLRLMPVYVSTALVDHEVVL